MKRKLAINIDYIIRDWETALINTYKRQIDENWDEQIINKDSLWSYFKFPIYILSSDTTATDYEISENVTYIDESKPPEPNEEIFNRFILDNILEIFGHAKEAEKNIMLSVNQLYYQGLNNDMEITLFSKIGYKGRPSTLFFLSKYGCEVANIIFINSPDDLLDFEYVLNKKDDVYILKDNIFQTETEFNNIKELADKLYK